MAITYLFAGLPVTDLRAASAWYEQVLGGPADAFPHPGEAVWHLTATGAVYVVEDAQRTGEGMLTLAVDDLRAIEARLRAAAIAATELPAGDAPRRIRIVDPDGNTLTFFEDPA